jgi:mono/diheme cytochrome c family protein
MARIRKTPSLCMMPRVFLKRAKGCCYMQFSLKRLPQPKLGRCLLVLGALYLPSAPAVQAQNIDEGKSAPQLYAATCAACHRNPGVLAKGRFRATLAPFLQDHYTTGVGEAWALAGYLASVDAGPARPKAKQAKRPPAPSAQPN